MTDQSAGKRRSWIRPLGFGMGLVVFVAIGLWGGRQALLAPFQPRILPFLLCFLITGIVFVIGSLRWAVIVDQLEGRKVSTYPRYFFYFLLTRFAGQYVSQSGSDLTVRPLMLRGGDHLPVSRGVGGVLLDKAFDLLFVIALLIPALLIMFQAASPALLIVVTIAALAVPWTVALNNRILPAIIRFGFRWASRFGSGLPILRDKIPRQDQTEDDNFSFLARGTLLLILGLTLLKYGALILRLVFLVQTLDLPISVTTIWAGIPIAQLSLLLAFTPGALGVLEGGWYAVLSVMGVGSDAISSFLIGQRLYWLAFSAVFALVGYLGLMVERYVNQRAHTD